MFVCVYVCSCIANMGGPYPCGIFLCKFRAWIVCGCVLRVCMSAFVCGVYGRPVPLRDFWHVQRKLHGWRLGCLSTSVLMLSLCLHYSWVFFFMSQFSPACSDTRFTRMFSSVYFRRRDGWRLKVFPHLLLLSNCFMQSFIFCHQFLPAPMRMLASRGCFLCTFACVLLYTSSFMIVL